MRQVCIFKKTDSFVPLRRHLRLILYNTPQSKIIAQMINFNYSIPMNKNEPPIYFMKKALMQAKCAYRKDEAPIGCVIVKNNTIIARGHNLRERYEDATLHAEMIAIRKACKATGSWRLEDCDLYVTLEPCYMCTGAIIQSRIRHVYFGASDPKGGAVVSTAHIFDMPHNHHVEYTDGILAQECGSLLSDFFRELRLKRKTSNQDE